MPPYKKLVYLFFVSTSIFAQEGIIKDSLPDPKLQPSLEQWREVTLKIKRKGRTTPLVRVEITQGTELLYTNNQGELKIKVKIGDDERLMLKKVGYETLFISTSEFEGKDTFELFLQPGEPDDNEVVIQGKRRPEVSKKTITIRETARVAPGGDPAQIAKLMPGVATQSFRNEVIIRGSGPQDSRYYVDDIEVPIIFHQIGNFSIIPDSLLSEVEFSSGGFGPQYGNATGGVIVLKTSTELPTEARSEYRLNVPFFLTATHERPLSDKSALYVSLRHSTSEWIIPQFIPKKAELTLVPYFGDAHLRYLKLEDDGFYKVTTIASDDGMVLGTPLEDSDQEDGRLAFKFRNRFAVFAVERQKRLSSEWKLKSTPQVAYADADINISFRNIFLKYDIVNVSVPTEVSYRHSPDRYFYLGAQPTYNQSNFNVRSIAPPTENDPFYDIEDAEVFTTRKHYTKDSWTAWIANDFGFGSLILTPGLRYFSSSITKDAGYDPRLAARYKIDDSDLIKAAVGQYSITPEVSEISDDFGNPNLSYERSDHYILGWEHNFSDRWLLDLQGFYKNNYHLIQGDAIKRYVNSGRRITQGAELFIRRNLTEKLMGWLAYTFSHSKERKNDNSNWFTSPYDQTHIVNLTGSYRLNARWDLGSRVKFESGNVYTPVTGSTYHAGYDKYLPRYNNDHPYNKRYPDSHLIDLFATYDSFYDTHKLVYRFGVQMIRFTKLRNSINYNFDYSEAKLSSTDLPPIPFAEVKGEF